MNAKTAKKLRMVAAQITKGFVPISYVTDNRGTTTVHPSCTRGVYRKLKRTEV